MDPKLYADVYAANEARVQRDADMKAKENMNKLYENTELVIDITPDRYDFEAAAYETDFSEAPDGGITLPNKYRKAVPPLAGYDLYTGEHVFDLPDIYGFGRTGFEKIRNGGMNTIYGADEGTLDGSIMLAIHAHQNGVPISELDLPLTPMQKDVVTTVASGADLFITTENAFASMIQQDFAGQEGAAVGQIESEGTLTREQLSQSPEFLDAAERIRAYLDPDGEMMAPEQLTNAVVQEMAMLMINEVKLASIITDAHLGQLDMETAQAYLYILDQYDRVSMFDREVILGSIGGVITSPLMWVSGGVGGLAAKSASKAAAVQALRQSLQTYVAAAAGGAAGGLELGTFMGVENVARQSMQVAAGAREEISAGEAVAATAAGGLTGVVLGGGLTTALIGGGAGLKRMGSFFRNLVRGQSDAPAIGAGGVVEPPVAPAVETATPTAAAPRPNVDFNRAVKQAFKDYKSDAATAEETVMRVASAFEDRIRALQMQRADRLSADRLRGPDWIKEKMMGAVRKGEITREAMDLATWLVDKNPALVDDLAISIRSVKDASGTYNPAVKLMSLATDNPRPTTAVHEIMHHAERTMPDIVQLELAALWRQRATDAVAAAEKAGDTQRVEKLTKLIGASHKSKAERDEVLGYFKSGQLTYEDYQFIDPSEFWAVNAADIINGRYGDAAWTQQAKQYIVELIEKIKDLAGLDSNADIIRALDGVIKGTGELRPDAKMLANPKRMAYVLDSMKKAK